MKKYRVLETIGNGLTGLSFMAFFFTLSADIEHSGSDVGEIVLLSILLSGLGMLLGQITANFIYVEGLFMGLSIARYAWLYSIFKRGNKLAICYTMMTAEGGYINLLRRCIRCYPKYVKYKTEVNHE